MRQRKLREIRMKARQRKQNIVVITFFLVLIFGMTAVTLVVKNGEFSEKENRGLAQRPNFSFSSYFSGTYAKDYESFLTDQFAFRNSWITMKTLTERAMLKQEINNIYYGKDGYLIESHTGSFSTDVAKRNVTALASFMERVSESYGEEHVTAMVVPNAVEILRDKLPPLAPESEEGPYLQMLSSSMPENIWFDSQTVMEDKKEESIFYKTDHHWETLGAFYVYQAWAKAKGFDEPSIEEYEISTLTDDFKGTIESKVGGEVKPDSIEAFEYKEGSSYQITMDENTVSDSLYDTSYLETKDKYSVFFGGNHPLVQVKVNNESERKILVIKDSYAHCFIPFLFRNFSQVDFIDLRYYNESLADYMSSGDYTDIMFLYNASGFAEDPNVAKLGN